MPLFSSRFLSKASLAYTGALISCAILFGCSGSSDGNGESPRGAVDSSGAEAKASPPPAIEYQMLALADLPKALENHKGKVVILDLWATW